MKSLAKAVGLASCCLLSTVSLAQAGEAQLSAVELDRVTAGGQLFSTAPAFDTVNNQLTPGGLIGPPAPPPPPPPAPPPLPSNQFTETAGPARATITVPTATGSGAITIVLGATSSPGFAAAEAGIAGSITGGANSRFQGGGSTTNISTVPSL